MGKDLTGKDLGRGISQRKDGRYIARYTDKYGKRSAPMYAWTEREIKKKLRDALYEEEHSIINARSSCTLRKWFDEWVKLYAQQSMKQSSVESCISQFHRQIDPYLGSVKLKDLTPLMIQTWATSRYNAGAGSIRIYLATLKHCLKDAVIAGLIPTNPAQFASAPASPMKQTPALTKDQLTYFIHHFNSGSKKCDWLLIIEFLALTGYRVGEMAGLQWGDIDWNKRQICIRRTLHYSLQTRNTPYFTTPKTKTSARMTPLTNQLESVLKQAKLYQEQWSRMFPTEWAQRNPELGDLVFLDRYGQPIRGSDLNHVLHNAVTQMNRLLPSDQQLPMITAHSFRGTFASICYELRTPIKEVQRLLGHAETSMTLYYTHISESQLADEAQDIHDHMDILAVNT